MVVVFLSTHSTPFPLITHTLTKQEVTENFLRNQEWRYIKLPRLSQKQKNLQVLSNTSKVKLGSLKIKLSFIFFKLRLTSANNVNLGLESVIWKPDKLLVLCFKESVKQNSYFRSVLDFDFEKLCSVSLSHINVYACLVCGKYFQGLYISSNIKLNAFCMTCR